MAKGLIDVCSMRIMFPVESDDKAIEVKKKIASILEDIPDSNMQFSLVQAPTSPPTPKI